MTVKNTHVNIENYGDENQKKFQRKGKVHRNETQKSPVTFDV